MKRVDLPSALIGTELEEIMLENDLHAQTKLKQATQKQNALNRITQRNAGILNIVELITNALIENVKTPLNRPKKPKIKIKSDKIIVISDFHYNGSVNSINDLSRIRDIMLIEKPDKIYLLGDTIDGAIRATDRFKSKLDASAQTLSFFDNFNQLLNETAFSGSIYILYGNHEEIRQFGDQYSKTTPSWAEILSNYLALSGFEVFHGHKLYDKSTKTLLIHGDKNSRDIVKIPTKTIVNFSKGKSNFKVEGGELTRKLESINITPEMIERVVRGHYHGQMWERFNGIDYIQFPAAYTDQREYDEKIGKTSIGRVAILENGTIKFI
jgi:predicted MPP superfamily phosphohydrolase